LACSFFLNEIIIFAEAGAILSLYNPLECLLFYLSRCSPCETESREINWRCRVLSLAVNSAGYLSQRTRLFPLFHGMEAGSGSLPASPADSGVSDVESSTSSGGNEDANLLLKARLNPNSSLQPSLASHHSHLSSGELDLYIFCPLSFTRLT